MTAPLTPVVVVTLALLLGGCVRMTYEDVKAESDRCKALGLSAYQFRNVLGYTRDVECQDAQGNMYPLGDK